jgi:lysozyme
MEAMAIDLSHWNTIPENLVAAKEAGIIGVIHKATESTTKVDDKLEARYKLAKDAGLLWGVYHFMRATSITQQVEHFLKTAAPFMDEETILAADHEDGSVSLAKLQIFLNEIKARTGKTPIIYSGHVLKEQLGGKANPQLARCPLWLAQYGPEAKLPPGWTEYFLWQYTQKGEVPGVKPPTDLNQGFQDRETLRAQWLFYAVGGGAKPEPEPGPPEAPVVKVIVPRGTKVVVDEY